MKKLAAAGVLIVNIFASNSVLAEATSTSKGQFHLPGMNCHTEDNDKIDSAPQSPPLVIDDPGTPGCNKWEINVVLSEDSSRDLKHFELPLLDINYGIGDDLQLKYEVPNISNQGNESSTTGVGESIAGLKYRFFESEESGLEMAFYPQIEFVTPNSDAVKKGLAEPGNVTSLPLIIAKKVGENAFGEVTMSLNLAYNSTNKTDTSDFISGALGIGAPLNPKVALMAELAIERAVSQDSSGIREEQSRASVGVMTPIFKRFLLFGSVGQSLYSSDGLNHTFFLTGVRL